MGVRKMSIIWLGLGLDQRRVQDRHGPPGLTQVPSTIPPTTPRTPRLHPEGHLGTCEGSCDAKVPRVGGGEGGEVGLLGRRKPRPIP